MCFLLLLFKVKILKWKFHFQFQLDWTKIFKNFTPNIEKNLLILISFLYRRDIDRALRKSAQTEKVEKGIVQTQLPLVCFFCKLILQKCILYLKLQPSCCPHIWINSASTIFMKANVYSYKSLSNINRIQAYPSLEQNKLTK